MKRTISYRKARRLSIIKWQSIVILAEKGIYSSGHVLYQEIKLPEELNILLDKCGFCQYYRIDLRKDDFLPFSKACPSCPFGVNYQYGCVSPKHPLRGFEEATNIEDITKYAKELLNIAKNSPKNIPNYEKTK
jgi:hypothetical protein